MKQKIPRTLFVAIYTLLLLGTNCIAQQKNEISVYAGFLQLKEELNQSMGHTIFIKKIFIDENNKKLFFSSISCIFAKIYFL
jgi:hypothetical protein